VALLALLAGLGVTTVAVPATPASASAGYLRVCMPAYDDDGNIIGWHSCVELLAGGTVTQLMHRLGQAYRRKWRLAEPVLRRLGVLAGPGGAGTAVLCLPGGRDARVAAAALRDRGVRVRPLAEYYAAAQPAKGRLPAPARSGLVVGYGHLPDPALRTGLAALAASLGRQRPA
jgi:DNA-binding transcriptional MocR family regulator